jgi:plastocyanin
MKAVNMVRGGSVQPGQDRILILGSEQGYGGEYADCNVALTLPSSDCDIHLETVSNCNNNHNKPNPHVVKVNAGDAVIFYNNYMTKHGGNVPQDKKKMQENRRSALHVALETRGNEKWIATNLLTVA